MKICLRLRIPTEERLPLFFWKPKKKLGLKKLQQERFQQAIEDLRQMRERRQQEHTAAEPEAKRPRLAEGKASGTAYTKPPPAAAAAGTTRE